MSKSTPPSTRHTPSEKDAILHLQTANELMNHSVMNIVTLAGEMQKQVTMLPEHPAKTKIAAMVSQLYQYCGFEDLTSQHITQAILLWNGMENHNSLMNGPSISSETMSQEDIDNIIRKK